MELLNRTIRPFKKSKGGEENEQREQEEYHYETDEFGRVKCAEGTLHLEKGTRNPKAQLKAGGEWRRDSDEGGHLIGTRFGGSGNAENLVAENMLVNRSGFKRLENEWVQNLKQGNDVSVKVEPIYQVGTERPYAITGRFDIHTQTRDQSTEYYSFTNENMETKEFELPEEADVGLSDFWDELD